MSLTAWVLGALGLIGGCVCALIALLVAVAVLWWVVSPSEAEAQMKEDRKDPRKAWIQGVGFTLMGGRDHAYLTDTAIGAMLEDAWHITDVGGFEAMAAELAGRPDERAWNLTRAILLTRAAVAVGYLDNAASWARCLKLGVMLQDTYRSWDAFAEDLLRSRRRWCEAPEDGSDDPEHMAEVAAEVAALRADHWKTVSWAQALE